MIEARSEKELLQILSQIRIDVPLRIEGRTKQHTERYAITYLLSSLGRTELEYPISLVGRERPDFLLCAGNRRIGIEHTEAVPPNEAHKDALRERGCGPNAHFISKVQPGEERRPKKLLICEIEENDPGEGWLGDEVERGWADAMLYVIQQKLIRLRKPGFKVFDENWLLFYDNWPLPDVRIKTAAGMLHGSVRQAAVFKEINRLLILSDRQLCDITDGGIKVSSANDLWS